MNIANIIKKYESPIVNFIEQGVNARFTKILRIGSLNPPVCIKYAIMNYLCHIDSDFKLKYKNSLGICSHKAYDENNTISSDYDKLKFHKNIFSGFRGNVRISKYGWAFYEFKGISDFNRAKNEDEEVYDYLAKITFYGKDAAINYNNAVIFIKKYVIYFNKHDHLNSTRKYINFYDNNSILLKTVGVDRSDIIYKDLYKVDNFINTWPRIKELYCKNGLVYKHGILLYGKPGTGKTTIAKYISTALNACIFYIDLSMQLTDIQRHMQRVVNQVNYNLNIASNGFILLFEEMDQLTVSRNCNILSESDNDRIEKQNYFLQVLDGLYSVDGMIVIATTNYIERIDPALIREGRFDTKLEMKEFDEEDAIQMCNKFNVPASDVLKDVEYPISPVKLQNKCLIYLQNKICI